MIRDVRQAHAKKRIASCVWKTGHRHLAGVLLQNHFVLQQRVKKCQGRGLEARCIWADFSCSSVTHYEYLILLGLISALNETVSTSTCLNQMIEIEQQQARIIFSR